MSLAPHPRLYLGPDEHRRLRDTPELPFLAAAARRLRRDANRFARSATLTYPRDCHNELLLRAREVQTRVVALLARWEQTGKARFREAAIAHLRQMGQWEYWSWIAWRQGDCAPDAIFDLSYGENSATLAIAFDWLHDTLDAATRDELLAIARKWPLAAARRHLLGEKRAWWYRHPHSNWNTVCAGGLGMLLLAMHEYLDDPAPLLAAVEDSFRPYMATLDEWHGAWPEGIGYWNYGMRYAFMYLLSHERATATEHPLLQAPGVGQTLEFPLHFTPNGQACSFGDVNHWHPLPFHYAVACRLDASRIRRLLDGHPGLDAEAKSTWPDAPEWLMLHPGRTLAAAAVEEQPIATLYGGLDWGILADRWPDARLALTVRGGTTKVPHGHLDLLSFHAVVGRERLIASLGPSGYLDTTFSGRRYELFEMAPPSKNTLLINGVGIAQGSQLDATERVVGDGCLGIRLIATSAMGSSRDSAAATFCGRLFLLLERGGALIVDQVELPFVGLVESRLHTYAKVRKGQSSARLSGQRERLRVVFAANVPALLQVGTDAPTQIAAPVSNLIRWATRQQVRTATLVTLLSPGDAPVALSLDTADDTLAIAVSRGESQVTVRLTSRLDFA